MSPGRPKPLGSATIQSSTWRCKLWWTVFGNRLEIALDMMMMMDDDEDDDDDDDDDS